MSARWEDPRPATDPFVLQHADTWLLVMFLLMLLAGLAVAL